MPEVSPSAWRKSIIFGAPLVLGILELGHPAVLPGDNIVATIVPVATWWTVLHLLQVPLFALLGVSVFLLVHGLDGRAAETSRYGPLACASFLVGALIIEFGSKGRITPAAA